MQMHRLVNGNAQAQAQAGGSSSSTSAVASASASSAKSTLKANDTATSFLSAASGTSEDAKDATEDANAKEDAKSNGK